MKMAVKIGDKAQIISAQMSSTTANIKETLMATIKDDDIRECATNAKEESAELDDIIQENDLTHTGYSERRKYGREA